MADARVYWRWTTAVLVLLIAGAGNARELTGSWEKEGVSPRVLDFYAPEPFIKCTNDMTTCATVSKKGVQRLKNVWQENDLQYDGKTMNVDQWLAMSYAERRGYMRVNRIYYNGQRVHDGQRDSKGKLLDQSAVVEGQSMAKIPYARLEAHADNQPDWHNAAWGEESTLTSWVPTAEVYRSFSQKLLSETTDETPYPEDTGDLDGFVTIVVDRPYRYDGRMWEITHDSYSTEFGQPLTDTFIHETIFDEVRWVTHAFPDPASSHIHLAFKRREFITDQGDLPAFGKKIAKLAYFLNDREFMLDTASVIGLGLPRSFTKFITAFDGSGLDQLVEHLKDPNIKSNTLERLVQGHKTGPWKFAYVAIRQNYGQPDTFGFEFRATTMPHRFEIIERVREYLNTLDVKAPGALSLPYKNNSGEMALLDYPWFNIADYSGLSAETCSPTNSGKLVAEAASLFVGLTNLDHTLKTHLPWHNSTDTDTYSVRRVWCAPLNATTSNLLIDGRPTFEAARDTYVAALYRVAGHLGKSPAWDQDHAILDLLIDPVNESVEWDDIDGMKEYAESLKRAQCIRDVVQHIKSSKSPMSPLPEELNARCPGVVRNVFDRLDVMFRSALDEWRYRMGAAAFH